MTDNIIKEALEEAMVFAGRTSKINSALSLIERGEVMRGQIVDTQSGLKTKVTWRGGSFPVLVIPLGEET